jgi:outer membrane murein-binding lipoprotein Lpp
MSLVSTAKFDELVTNTTRYIQDLVNRVNALEKKVEELEKPKKTNPRARKENANV